MPTMIEATTSADTCVVYFLQAEDGPIKIGFTNDLRRRLGQLQHVNHHKLRLRAVLPGDRVIEAMYHMQFIGLRLRGEWFRPDPMILNAIAAINAEHEELLLRYTTRKGALIRKPAEFKITDPEKMKVTHQPPLHIHPGVYIRDVLLPQYGLKVAPLARLIGVARPNLYHVLQGSRDVSRELAYRLGALMNDHVADFLISYQLAWDKQQEVGRREELKREINRLTAPTE